MHLRKEEGRGGSGDESMHSLIDDGDANNS